MPKSLLEAEDIVFVMNPDGSIFQAPWWSVREWAMARADISVGEMQMILLGGLPYTTGRQWFMLKKTLRPNSPI
jgi:hypothetical protein